MTLLQAILLGIIQGVTEFLPISSDGHLVLADRLLDLPLEGKDALGFDILLHAGSVIAILVVYFSMWKKILLDAISGKREAWRVIMLIIAATIPGVIAGLLFEDTVSSLRSFTAAGIGFLVTGCVLIGGEWIARKVHAAKEELSDIGYLQAILIGCAQAVAILPGVSRSGSTISVARALGYGRKAALDFSFLMALPIIGGAVVKTGVDAMSGSVVFPSLAVCIAGFMSSLLVSMLAISFLKTLVRRRSIAIFAWYVLPLGMLCVAWASFGV